MIIISVLYEKESNDTQFLVFALECRLHGEGGI